jgi:hypothetical protein
VSHAANLYVKKLKVAPTGETIQASERALLWYLGDCHSEEAGGIAWPSIKTLGEHLDLSQRQVRRLISTVEAKGIIGRVAQQRENGSYQSNSFYFIELQALPLAKAPRFEVCVKPKKNGGKPPKKSGKPEGKPAKKTTPTLTPMSGYPDAHVSTTLTPVSGLEAPIEAPVEAPDSPLPPQGGDDGDDDHSQEQTTSKTRTARAKISTPDSNPLPDPPHRGKWDEFKAELERQLLRLPEKLREGAMEAYTAAISDTTLIGEGCDGDTIEPTWTIGAMDPAQTHSALQLLWPQVKSALWKSAKGNVILKVFGGSE